MSSNSDCKKERRNTYIVGTILGVVFLVLLITVIFLFWKIHKLQTNYGAYLGESFRTAV